MTTPQEISQLFQSLIRQNATIATGTTRGGAGTIEVKPDHPGGPTRAFTGGGYVAAGPVVCYLTDQGWVAVGAVNQVVSERQYSRATKGSSIPTAKTGEILCLYMNYEGDFIVTDGYTYKKVTVQDSIATDFVYARLFAKSVTDWKVGVEAYKASGFQHTKDALLTLSPSGTTESYVFFSGINKDAEIEYTSLVGPGWFYYDVDRPDRVAISSGSVAGSLSYVDGNNYTFQYSGSVSQSSEFGSTGVYIPPQQFPSGKVPIPSIIGSPPANLLWSRIAASGTRTFGATYTGISGVFSFTASDSSDFSCTAKVLNILDSTVSEAEITSGFNRSESVTSSSTFTLSGSLDESSNAVTISIGGVTRRVYERTHNSSWSLTGTSSINRFSNDSFDPPSTKWTGSYSAPYRDIRYEAIDRLEAPASLSSITAPESDYQFREIPLISTYDRSRLISVQYTYSVSRASRVGVSGEFGKRGYDPVRGLQNREVQESAGGYDGRLILLNTQTGTIKTLASRLSFFNFYRDTQTPSFAFLTDLTVGTIIELGAKNLTLFDLTWNVYFLRDIDNFVVNDTLEILWCRSARSGSTPSTFRRGIVKILEIDHDFPNNFDTTANYSTTGSSYAKFEVISVGQDFQSYYSPTGLGGQANRFQIFEIGHDLPSGTFIDQFQSGLYTTQFIGNRLIWCDTANRFSTDLGEDADFYSWTYEIQEGSSSFSLVFTGVKKSKMPRLGKLSSLSGASNYDLVSFKRL